ncbi:MAG: T9SS type A sorting domain-containing protein, partial [Bacteroidota bacterium]
SNVQFAVRWNAAADGLQVLELIDSEFEIAEISSGEQDGYVYKIYAGVPAQGVPVTWTPGQAYRLALLHVAGQGAFELVPAGFLRFGTSDWYVEVDWEDRTDPVFVQGRADNTALPVELDSFTADVQDRSATLNWRTLTEEENAGFAIEHAEDEGVFVERGYVEGAGTTTEAQEYAYRIDGLALGRHRFRLKQTDFDGTTAYSPIVEVTVDLPGQYALDPAYPNPFNPQTTIRFAVREAQPVRVLVYDVQGRLIQTLYDSTAEASRMYRVRLDGTQMASGLYFVRLLGEDFTTVRKVVLAK